MNRCVKWSVLALASMCLTVVSVQAADESLQKAQHKAVLAQKRLEAALWAKPEEKSQLLSDHMHMIKELMSEMRAMKPAKEMTMAEHEEWISAHQRLMDDVMGQMMADHEMMMTMKSCR